MKKVLIIDDNQTIVEALLVLLEMEGYRVTTRSHANNILTLLQESTPDIILLDLLLSGEVGENIVKIIKTNQATNHIPIVLMSAHPDAKKRAKQAGADDFLAKPFDVEDLLTLIKKYTG